MEPWAAPHPLGTETKGGISTEETDPSQPRGEAVPGANAVRNSTGGLRSQESAHSLQVWGEKPNLSKPESCRQGPRPLCTRLFSWLLVESISQPSLESVLIIRVFSHSSCSFPGFRICRPSSPPRGFPPGRPHPEGAPSREL